LCGFVPLDKALDRGVAIMLFSLRCTAPALGLAILTSLASGCDDGETVTFRQEKCGEICARYEMCNDETDVTDCESACAAEVFRSDTYFELKAKCVTNLSCNRLIERDDSVTLNDCVGDAMRDEELGPDASDLCMGLSTKLAACVSSVDVGEVHSRCEAVAITLSEDYLAGSQACSLKGCAEISSCLAELADTFDTDVRVYSGQSAE